MRRNILIFSLLAIAFSLTSCNKDDVSEILHKRAALKNAEKDDTGITLGNKLENAYSVANMQIAYAKLVKDGILNDNYTIEPTHYYVKILPQDTSEVNLLVDDTNLALFPYPLDYEIIGTGSFVPNEGDEPWLYTVVPIDYDLSQFAIYTILEDCYIPDLDSLPELEDLERFSLGMTGNWQYDGSNKKWFTAPEGDIRVYNTITDDYDGARNVQVLMNTLVRVHKAYTDVNGHYVSRKKFLTNVNYTLACHNRTSSFQVWGNLGSFAPATLCLGVHSHDGYPYDIDTNMRAWYWVTINNAASIYIEQLCDTFNILKPERNLRIFALNMGQSWSGSAPMLRHWNCATYGIAPIDVYGLALATGTIGVVDRLQPDVFFLKKYGTTQDIYYHVFHELAHTSHYSLVGKPFWSNFVKQVISDGGYGYGHGDLSGYVGVGEIWGFFAQVKLYNKYRNMTDSTDTICYDRFYDLDTTYWFKPGILKDVAEFIPVDSIFSCLTATNLIDLKQLLILRNPNYNNEIEISFISRGF